MDERTERELSGMFAAYREYGAAKREASRTAVPTLLGGVLAAGAVAVGGHNPMVVVAVAVGMLVLLVLHVGAVGRRVAARAKLEAVMDEKLRERRG